ncbi:MAG: GPR endopeptidase [Bacilli bacterium]|nr:GPR endopeptidase [Bacilli bacterium]MDD4809481.1 GPR endopeptidase [Bacilli bacterium]
MKHEIDLKHYQIRTDLAIDTINEKTKGIKVKTTTLDDIKITNVVIEPEGSNIIKKKEGNYITIEFKDVTDTHNKEKVREVFSNELKKLLEICGIKEDDSCLIIGLGNAKSTPDALGPLSINNVLVTNHLFEYGDVIDGYRRTFAITPGVMGQTGIETSNIIISVIKEIRPHFIIVIDALASQSIERVNRTIQMTDTGIQPGSGVGNSRKEISKDVLNVPVIAIGVPTVVDAVTIVSDTFNYMYQHFSYMKEKINDPANKLKTNINYLNETIDVKTEDKESLMGMVGNLKEEEIKQLIFEVLTPIGYNLMVTPKEIDFIVDKLSDVIGNGIDYALHKNIVK